jgi:hypothetical protein
MREVEESRDRKRPLKVFVSERERAEIETRAAATGLSVSAYLRNLGLGFQPQSTLDHGKRCSQAAAVAFWRIT